MHSRRVGGAFVLVAFSEAPRRSNAVGRVLENHQNPDEAAPTSR